MGWLRKLFSSAGKKEQNSQLGKEAPYDDFYQANSDIIEGVQFSATLQLRVPLKVLQHHGEMFYGSPSDAPKYGDQSEGVWLPAVKGYDMNSHNHASDIGQVNPNHYLPFLLEFRKVVESDNPVIKKLEKLDALFNSSQHNKEILKKLSINYEDFPHSFFYREFTKISKVGGMLAREIYNSGYTSLDELRNASLEDLTSIKGLGKNTAATIQSFFNQ